jgi:hypothetical protein
MTTCVITFEFKYFVRIRSKFEISFVIKQGPPGSFEKKTRGIKSRGTVHLNHILHIHVWKERGVAVYLFICHPEEPNLL